MKKNLTTPVGQAEDTDNDPKINAINQIFALFRRNYHNQYYRALPNEQELSVTKRLWLESLSRFNSTTLLKAAKSVIESSEYLPTLRTMIKHCEQAEDPGLPDPHSAYIEACRAPSPKANYAWRHPAVYHAGKSCDWFFLQSNSENIAFPIFRKEYEKLCQRVLNGEQLEPPQALALTEPSPETLDKSKNLENLAALKRQLDL